MAFFVQALHPVSLVKLERKSFLAQLSVLIHLRLVAKLLDGSGLLRSVKHSSNTLCHQVREVVARGAAMSNADANRSRTTVKLMDETRVEPHKFKLQGSWHWLLTLTEMIFDGATIAAAVFCSYAVYKFFGLGVQARYSSDWVWIAAFGIAFLYVILLDREGAYKRAGSLLRIKETQTSLSVAVTAFLLVLPVTFFANLHLPRWVFALALILAPAFQIVEKQLAMIALERMWVSGFASRKVLIYGAGETGRRVFSAMMRTPKFGFEPIAFVDDNEALRGLDVYDYSYRKSRFLPVLDESLSVELLQRLKCDFLVVTIPHLDSGPLARIAETAREANVSFARVSPDILIGDVPSEHLDLDGMILNVARKPGRDWYATLVKRPFDLIFAPTLTLLILPVWLTIALLVRLDSKGPIFFTQKRVGLRGKEFGIYKFRSMYVDAPQYSFSPKESEDPRITRIGRFLRRTSLDELPQLLNVLKGDMSLVGPRPEMPFIVNEYSALQKQRLEVLPGITGLWQLSSDRSAPIHENIQYDMYYIRHRDFFMDCAILIHTLLFAMHGV
jgi:exopolysaccharide biosynthesis polyprenyl glycosylphosphotransferase